MNVSNVLSDYPEEPHQYWKHSHCSCQHSQQHDGPQTGTEDERTEANGADTAEDIPAGDVISGREAAETENVSTDAVREGVFPAAGEEDAQPQTDSGINNWEDTDRHGQNYLAVSEEDLAGVLEELGLTLKTTSNVEQEKIEDLHQLVETETSVSQVRRRNKRRRAKKCSH